MTLAKHLAALLAVLIMAPVVAQSEAATARLAQRLLAGPPAGESVVVIFPETLPDDLRVELPFPEDAELIGSMTRLEGEGSRFMQIILDVPHASDAVMTEVLASLQAAGWLLRSQHTPGGFIMGNANRFAELCIDNGPFLYLNVAHVEGGPTELRFDVSEYPHSVCGAFDMEHHHPEGVPLPQLVTPDGLTYTYMGNHWDTDGASSSARLQGDPSLAMVASEYEEQLEAQGWLWDNASESEDALWSRWTLHDEGVWQGIFSVIAADEGDFFASFFMARLGE